jgi:hypothetical protein
MQDAMTTRVGQRIGRIAALGAVALVLAGVVATPAEARTRESARAVARADGGMCAETGGYHSVRDTGSSVQMLCYYDDGTMHEWELPYDGS